MPTNEGRKRKDSGRSKVSAQSRGDEERLKIQMAQAQQAAETRTAADLDGSVASPEPVARATEAVAAPHGEAELPPPNIPARAEVGRPRGRLLDAWHATYSSPLVIGLLKSRPPVVETAMEFISVPDDRQPVTNTTDFPWRCICFLIATAPDGTSWAGTGWFASARLVLTAGHVVYYPERGGWATQVEVFPGRNGGDSPLGSSVSSTLRSVRGWTQAQDPAADYGAILLSEDFPGGYFGYWAPSDGELQNVRANVFGYPAEDKPEGTLWGNSRFLSTIKPRQLYYQVSTAEGESGAPVFIKEGDDRTAVGIHNYGGTSSNFATRITDEVANNIETWTAGGI